MAYYLIGHPLGHSCSPQLHSYFGNEDYHLRDVAEHELKSVVLEGEYDGLNVTIPYKRQVIPYMDILTPRAEATGAVNTVVRTREGKLLGDNTDIDGMERLIRSASIDLNGRKVLILGTGGTAHTADWVARTHGAAVVRHVSRTGEIHYGNVYEVCADTEVLINTTPVGMMPDLDGCPVEPERFPELKAVIDVVYQPLRTTLTLRARRAGIPAVNGLRMLVEQARAAEELFFARQISDEESAAVYRRLRRSRTNIVLIGMPGSGKTSVGRLLAQQLGRPFMDTDSMIVETCGTEIPEIFEKEGETFFRDRETEAIRDASCRQGIVVAVGGGAPLRDINKQYLRQNGRVYLLDRSLADLDRTGRPLSSSAKVLEKMLESRLPHYLALADMTVSNHETLAHCAELIEEDFANEEDTGAERPESEYAGHP